jgi:hypothetical protein
MVPTELGVYIAVVIGALLLVIGLVFSVHGAVSGGIIIWMVAGLCYWWQHEDA